jgi:23S rRNA (uracil1939-C5)-methyltransferase
VGELPDGRICFVHRTAPGDLVRIRVVRDKPRWATAIPIEVVEAGPDRRPSPCPFYDRCGGCTLQHVGYDAQREAKTRIVADALDRIGGIPRPAVRGPLAAPSEFEYRSRVTFHLRRVGRNRVVAGFHELERSRRIFDVDGPCLLAEGPIVRAWADLRRAWGPGADRLPSGPAHRLTLRTVVGGVILVVEPEPAPSRRDRGTAPSDSGEPEELLKRVDALRAVWWVHDGEAELLAGDSETEEVYGRRRVRTGPGAFVQVNRPAAALLERAVASALGDPRGRHVIDGYCGIGERGRHVARNGGTAVGIELDPVAASAAKHEAPEGFRVLEGRIEDRFEEALPADVLLVNPPRSGLAETLPARIVAADVERVLYASCDPATLARDLARFGHSYHLTSVEAFDLFPQTSHVEVLAVLDRCTGPDCLSCGAP